MGIKERREREKEEVRRLIMDAARRLFVEQGYEAVSMRKIADAIEYSPAAVYVHFRDKEDLIRAIAMEDYRRFDEDTPQLAQIADPVERICQVGLGYMRVGLANPHHYKLMFMTPPPLGHDQLVPPEDFNDPSKNGYALLRHAVREAMAAGRFAPEYTDPELVSQMCWAAVHGVTSLLIAMERDPCVKFHDVEGLQKLMCDVVIRGLLR